MRTRSLLPLMVLPLAACLATHSTESLEVDVSIASVSLADDCGSAGLIGGERCDSSGPCPDLCQQSSLQLHIEASAEGSEVPFEIVSVRVIDPETGGSSSLTARNPRVFVDGYTAWDETIAPSDALDVSYDTSAPDWGAIHESADSFGWGQTYDVEVRVRVDGVERTLTAEAMREPEIAT
ncbi:MAG: hypothetical protein J0L92_21050 [Deltaproteobacteria bacterium]|nr:hypothetical protein [Deltaproteobacteria bacterium]